MSDGHYLGKFFLVSEISLILYHTRLMILRLQFDIYRFLEIFLNEQKIHLNWKCPPDMEMTGFIDFIVE